MGGCVSKPKDLGLLVKSSVAAPATKMIEAETRVPQENNGGEPRKTEDVVESPEIKEEAKDPSEQNPSDKPKEESKVEDEEKKEADVAVSPEPVKATEPVKEEAKPIEA